VHFHNVLETVEYPEEWLQQGWYLERGLFSSSFPGV